MTSEVAEGLAKTPSLPSQIKAETLSSSEELPSNESSNFDIFPDGISLIISVIALALSIVSYRYKKIEFNESREFQTLIQIRTSTSISSYSDGIEIISSISCNDFGAFQKKYSYEERKLIVATVEHLNFIANLVECHHVKKLTVWRLYFQSYRLIFNKLEPWWFEAISNKHPKRFSAARRMAEAVSRVTEREIEIYDKNAERIYDTL